jgi:hypothetical protein
MAQPTNQPGPGNDPGTGGHPAWDEVLNLIPEDTRPAVSEKLKSWDTGVNDRFTKLQSEYEPWKPFMTDYTPDDINTAVGIAQALQADPQAFYQQMAEAYGFNSDQGQGGQQQQQQQQGDDDLDPVVAKLFEEKFGKLESAIGALAQHLQQQQTQTEEERQLQQLEQTLTKLKDTHGEFDLDYVCAKIAAGITPEDAVKQYQELTGNTQRQDANNNVPPILGAGGGLPTNQVDPATLGDKETRDLVANLIAAAQQQG